VRVGVRLSLVVGAVVFFGVAHGPKVRAADAYPYADKPCVWSPHSVRGAAPNWCADYAWGDRPNDASLANVISPYGYYYRNCTDYAAWKLHTRGVSPALYKGLGNAKDWAARAQLKGLQVNVRPAVGSVAVRTTGPYGHTAFVEAVNPNGTIKVSAYNGRADGNYGEATGTPNALGFSRFIHFEAVTPKKPAAPVAKPRAPAPPKPAPVVAPAATAAVPVPATSVAPAPAAMTSPPILPQPAPREIPPPADTEVVHVVSPPVVQAKTAAIRTGATVKPRVLAARSPVPRARARPVLATRPVALRRAGKQPRPNASPSMLPLIQKLMAKAPPQAKSTQALPATRVNWAVYGLGIFPIFALLIAWSVLRPRHITGPG
jgi:surface antigen